MTLPEKYKWLADEPGPRMLIEALKLYGKKEQPGTGDNPEILAWAQETRLQNVYSADSIPWCGLFMAVVAKRSDKEIPKDPLWARNWAKFGQEQIEAALGDVLVFKRGNGGHVAIYVGEDNAAYHVLGGNQSDQVSITRIAKNRLLAIRRPEWKIAQPANVRRVFVNSGGELSENEA
jgi:uncharacterized protein (TIGR02594 family)